MLLKVIELTSVMNVGLDLLLSALLKSPVFG